MRRIIAAFIVFCALLQACSQIRINSIDEAMERQMKISDGVYIDDVNVSDMTVQEARKALAAAHRTHVEKLNYTVTAGDKSIRISAKELPVTFDSDAAILSALNSPVRNEDGIAELKSAVSVDEPALEKRISAMMGELYSSPSDASYSFAAGSDTPFTYEIEKNGVSVDSSRVVPSIKTALTARISAGIRPLVNEIQPEYTVDMAKRDTSLIAEFSTSFSGSTYGKKNRVQNIVKAAAMINGITVAPGDELDLNAILGGRTEEKGWSVATGIRDGKYVQEAGGGVCQVSTTLYNAVLMANLEVTERWHHSWPLGYVAVGRDATISTGGPNFKFKNTSSVSVVIAAFTDLDKKTVTVRIFGRTSDDYAYIEVHSWKTGVIKDPGSEVKLDRNLPFGTEVIERESRAGCTSETYKYYYDKEGKLLKKERVTKDKYRAIKGLKLVSADIYESSVNANAAVDFSTAAPDAFIYAVIP